MATTYNFKNFNIDQMITEAYERVFGDVKTPSDITQRDIDNAKRSLNLILSQWMNSKIYSWNVNQILLTLYQSQTAYTLDSNVAEVLPNQVVKIQSTRQLDGTASSSSGTAANAFDNDIDTTCLQTAPNGWIAYDFGSTAYSIPYVGIISGATLNYTITVEYSYEGDFASDDTYTAYEGITTTYTKDILQWIVLPPNILAKGWRIRETGGATLNVAELYFNLIPSISLPLTPISRDLYLKLNYKNTPALTTCYWVDRKINPIFYLYQMPDTTYPYVLMNVQNYVKDVDTLQNYNYLPQRFLEALTAALAAALALKYRKDVYGLLNDESLKAYNIAIEGDNDVPYIQFRYNGLC